MRTARKSWGCRPVFASGFACFLLATGGGLRAQEGTAPDPALPRAHPDWKVELLAAPPRLVNPSVLCTAPDGRLFVAQDPMDMGGDPEKPTDSILCFHPDGKVTTFATGLHAVFGLAYLDGKIYVHHCPKFSVLTDDHGVGVDRRELFTTNPEPASSGFNDHLPSNMRLAMDGFFYMSTGDKGIRGATGIDGSRAEIHGGGILRFRPDGTRLEVYTIGTRNHLDVAVNVEDEMFTYDNTDDGNGWETRVTHMVDGGFYGYPYDYKPQRPYTLWMMDDFGHGAPAASITYNEDALPPEYRGNLFLSDWGRKKVRRLKISRDGATYKIDEHVRNGVLDFVDEGLKEFRPIGLAWSPDGMSLYIADWNFGGWKSPQIAGRLFKVTYAGPSLAAPKPAWWLPLASGKSFDASTDELITGLKHPAQSVRMVAQRRLAERGQAAVKPLVALLADSGAPAHARWHAIWALDALDAGAAARKEIIALVADTTDASVRAQAVRQLGTRRVKEVAGSLASALQDANPVIRFRAATSLGRIGEASVVPALLQGLAEQDLFARYATFTALNRICRVEPSAWAAIAKGLASDDPRIREGTLFAMRETFDQENVTALAAFVAGPNAEPAMRASALNILADLHRQRPPWDGKWWGTQPVKGAPPPKTVDWAGTPGVLAAINDALRDTSLLLRRAAVAGVQTTGDKAAAPALRAMFVRESDDAIRKAILLAFGTLKDTAAGPIVAGILAAPAENAALLMEAITAAGHIGDNASVDALSNLSASVTDEETLLHVLSAIGETHSADAVPAAARLLRNPNSKINSAAGEALAAIGGATAAKAVLPLLDDADLATRNAAIHASGLLRIKKALPRLMALYRDPATRAASISALEEIPDMNAIGIYLEAIEESDDTIREHARRALQHLREKALPVVEERHRKKPFSSRALPELQRAFNRIEVAHRGPLFESDTKPASAEEYAKYAMANAGDPKDGRKIFESTIGCTICHAVDGKGGQIGPDLGGIGVRYARATLIESVLYPSKQVFDGYRTTMITLKNGDALTGFVRDEGPAEFTLIDAAGQKRLLLKNQVAKREESNLSLMPEGLHTALSLSQFADLIAYLENLKGKER